MKNLVSAALVATLGLGTITDAFAQYTRPLGASLRAGMFFPFDGDARTDGNTWIGVGLDWKLGDLKFGDQSPGYSANYGLSLDYYGKGSFSSVPVLLNYVGRTDQFYYGAGLGVAFVRRPDAFGGSDTTTEIGYALFIGFDFQRGATPLFIEGRFMGSGRAELNGAGVYLGVRF